MDTEKKIQHRGGKRHERKFGPNVTGMMPRPVDLRIKDIKAVQVKVFGDQGNICLSPRISVYERLGDLDESTRYA